jgi:hypothetical protein
VPAGQADACDAAPGGRRAQQFPDHGAADVVHRAAPGRFFQRSAFRRKGVAVNHARGAQFLEPGLGVGFPAHGHDLIALARQQIDRDAAHPAGRAGDDDRSGVRRQPILLQPLQGQRRGKTGGTERHRREGVEVSGQGDDEIGGYAHVFRITAVVVFRQTAAGHQHRIARTESAGAALHDRAGDVDAADQRQVPCDLPAAGSRERVLVVHGGILGPDGHIAGVEVVQRQRGQLTAVTVLAEAVGAEWLARQLRHVGLRFRAGARLRDHTS